MFDTGPSGPPLTTDGTRDAGRCGTRGFAAVVLCLAAGGGWAQDAPQPQHLPSTRLQAGMHNIDAEMARTPREREIGLMFRPALGDHAGMLFTFDEPAVQ